MLLGVNIDHIATLRQARLTSYPDPLEAALIAERSGADSITVHMREDRRHIQENDVRLLKEKLTKPLNLEMAVTDEMVRFAVEIKPEYCCLVPEKREELTTEGGLDIISQMQRITLACQKLQESGIRVSLFIDPDKDQIEAASQTGSAAIEIHTGHYANAEEKQIFQSELERINMAVKQGNNAGLQVNAGHGLNYNNVAEIVSIPGIVELNIGHSIIARAIYTGLAEAVREMKKLISGENP